MSSRLIDHIRPEAWTDEAWPEPPWYFINSAQLAARLGISVQTTWNWRLRGSGPLPEPAERFRGRKRWYEIAAVRAWLETLRGVPTTRWDMIAASLPRVTLPDEEPSPRLLTIFVRVAEKTRRFDKRGQPRQRAGWC